jgi:hypothetical protein
MFSPTHLQALFLQWPWSIWLWPASLGTLDSMICSSRRSWHLDLSQASSVSPIFHGGSMCLQRLLFSHRNIVVGGFVGSAEALRSRNEDILRSSALQVAHCSAAISFPLLRCLLTQAVAISSCVCGWSSGAACVWVRIVFVVGAAIAVGIVSTRRWRK